MNKLGFTGTRKGMTHEQAVAFDEFVSTSNFDELHVGDCVGADVDAYNLWQGRTVGHIPESGAMRAFLEYDETREPLPYLTRNRSIVNEADVIVATPATRNEQRRSGTWATIRYAHLRDKPVVIIFPDGSRLLYRLHKFTARQTK